MNTFIIAEIIWFSHFFLFPYTDIYISIGRTLPHIFCSPLFEKQEKNTYQSYKFLLDDAHTLYYNNARNTKMGNTTERVSALFLCFFMQFFKEGKNAG